MSVQSTPPCPVVESLATTAATPAVVCTGMLAGGATEKLMETVEGPTVMVVSPNFVESATEVARSVTVLGVGTTAGAVYVTGLNELLSKVPQDVPHATPFCSNVHVTF